MKKLILIFLTFILTFTFTACGGGEEGVAPEYSTKFTYNGDLHWRNQLNGNGRTDVGEHKDDGTGTCSVCGYVLYEASYSNTFSFDNQKHWKEQTNGTGRIEEGFHVKNSGKCRTCNYYYDATEFLAFEKCKVGDVEGYMVTEMLDQDFDEEYFPRHIEIPTHYQGEDDESPLPVISIGYAALSSGVINDVHRNDIRIKSVKLNEGLLEIRDWAFRGSDITELIIPNSTTNEHFMNPGTVKKYGAIYNLVENKLDKFATGGIKILSLFNFTNGTKEVILGEGLEIIQPRAFHTISSLSYLVIPKTVNCILEGTIPGSGNYAKIPSIKIFPDNCVTPIFMEITKEEHDALLVEPRKRDLQGNVLDPLPEGSIGFVKGWSGNSPVYFKGEWHYNKWGKPVADI